MADFHFAVGPQVWMGPDTLLRLPLLVPELAGPESLRALLIADPMLYDPKIVGRVLNLLEDRGVELLVFDEIPERATSAVAEDALKLARGSRSPLIIGLGGVKTLMIARTVAALAQGSVDVDSFVDGSARGCASLPLIEIPTSLRHSFMADECVVLADSRDRKPRLLRSAGMTPTAVLIDPNLSASLSPKLAASCLLAALMSAVESYISIKSTFMSDLVLEKAVASIAQALDAVIARPDDPMARSLGWQGSFLAGLGQSLSAPGIATSLTLAINARYPVPKASLAAILLPYSMESAMKSRLEKIAALAPLLGIDTSSLSAAEAATKSVEWLRTRLGLLKIPSRLKDFDLVLDRLVEVSRDARELDFMNYLPRAVSVDDVFDFVKMAY